MKRLSLVLALVLASLATVLAQRTVTGTVVDDTGEALIGATVLVTGTNVGTVTDIEGNFSLRVPEGGESLQISYTGYAAQEIELTASNVVTVTLRSDVIGLEDVIVIGYAPTKRKDLTGAVSSVSGESINREAGASLQSALRGRAAGVVVQQNNGAPGSGFNVRVRGATSITASNNPLYVVDGVPIIDADFSQEDVGGQGISTLADINPNDIASIEVLKDASTTAIYGSRAANGVVLITTKTGSAGQTKVDFNATYGFNEPIKTIPVVDNAGYREYITVIFGTDDLPWVTDADNNWQDLIFGTNPTQSYNMSVTGGDQKTKFFTSLNHDDNEGILKGSRYRRYNARLNLDHRVSDKFSVGTNLSYNYSINKRIQNDNNIYGAVSTSILLPPTLPIFNEDGTYGSAFGLENPVAAVTEYDNNVRTNRIIGNVNARYFLTNNLSFQVKLGVDNINLQESIFQPSVLQSSTQGSITEGTVVNTRLINEYLLTYTGDIGRTSIVAVGGYSLQNDDRRQTLIVTNDLPTDNFPSASSAASPQTTNGFKTGDVLNSFVGNVNINFDSRFYLTASFRADGSSRFVNDQWGFFPGVSAAWNLTNEDFLANSSIDLLKLRVGYGITGNNNIGNFTTRALFGGGAPYLTSPGVSPIQIGNPDLVWETTKQTNIGLDLGFFNNRVSASLDYYIKDTEDLILNRPVPTTSGFTVVPQNIGDIRNNGFEATITVNPVQGDFNWTTAITAAFNKNEVVTLFQGQPIDAGFATRIAEGQPLGSFFGHMTDGIFQNQGEVEAHATQNGAAPGDIRFVDINGDGVINDEDRTFIGQALPDWSGGIDNNFSWKGLSLNVFFQFSLGNNIFNNNLAFAEGLNSVFAPTVRAFEGAWRAEGDGDDFPRIVNGDPNNNRRESDRFTEDGSYMRLKTATLSYDFPKSVLGDKVFRSLRVFIQGTNLITWTKYSWFDPEVSTFGDQNVALGTDFLTYPQARTMQFGINLGF